MLSSWTRRMVPVVLAASTNFVLIPSRIIQAAAGASSAKKG
jgi:hypothetical protein